MTEVRLTLSEYDRQPAAARRLAESGMTVVISDADGTGRAWMTGTPPGCESEASADD